MVRRARALLRDLFLKLPFSGKIQRAVWRRRENRRQEDLEARCKLLHDYGEVVFCRLDRALTASGIRWFIDFGTLLGCVREHGFIPHDIDIDVSLFTDDKPHSEIVSFLEKEGFVYKHHFEHEGRVLEYTFTLNGIPVDFFIQFADGEKWRYHESHREYGRSYPTQTAFTCYWQNRNVSEQMLKFSFAGCDVTVPDNYQDILSSYYGKEWRIPTPNFHFDRCAVEGFRGELPGYSYVFVDRSRLLSK